MRRLHPLDRWFESLEEVRDGDVVAWRDRDAEPHGQQGTDPESVVLQRSLWRVPRKEVAEYCLDFGLDVWAELEPGEMTPEHSRALRAWMAPQREILKGTRLAILGELRARLRGARPFGMWFRWDQTPCGSSESFLVQPVTRDRSVLGHSTECDGLGPTPLGLVDAADPVRSAALLLALQQDKTDWFDPEWRPSDFGHGGLSRLDFVRLVCARDRSGGKGFCHYSDEELPDRVRECDFFAECAGEDDEMPVGSDVGSYVSMIDWLLGEA